MDYEKKYNEALEHARAEILANPGLRKTEHRFVAFLERQEQKPAEWSEKYIADIFEKVGLAKIVREQGNDALTNALQSTMIELSKVGNAEWSEEEEKDVAHIIRILDDCYAYGRHDLSKTDHENLINTLKSLRPSIKEQVEEPEYYQHFDPDC